MFCRFCFASLLFTLFQTVQLQGVGYIVPSPEIKVFTPKGIRVSIPDQTGVQLFGFHGKINTDFKEFDEPGDIDKSTVKSKNGLWIIEDDTIQLEIGDTIYYWIIVQFNNLGFRKINQKFQVKELLTKDGSAVVTDKPAPGDGGNSGTGGDNGNAICEPTATQFSGSACSKDLIFFDDFTGNSLNTETWMVENFIPFEPDYEFVSYQQSNQYVQDGILYIKPTILSNDEDFLSSGSINLTERCTGTKNTRECEVTAVNWMILPPIVSARVNTKTSFNFLYGKIEIRAKFPKGDWIYPELYLMPKDQAYGPHYASGRICIALATGNQNLRTNDGRDVSARLLTGGYVLAQDGRLKAVGLKTKLSNKPWSDDFHTYTLIWRPGGITVSVDGETYGIIQIPDSGFRKLAEQYNQNKHAAKWNTARAPFDKQFYIAIGVGVGGVTEFPDRSISESGFKPWGNTNPKYLLNFWKQKVEWYSTWNDNDISLKVDYVKVWAL